jgi:16S rRNA (adenine1518-N6/adenine1519-N6)-dimethyltransferase
MDLTSAKNIKNLFLKYKIQPSKGLGQNFLINKKSLEQILESANLQKDDTILEVGPGVGNLTQELAKRVKKVISVEKDQKMVEILKETLKEFKNVEITKGDILKIGNWELIENWKLKIENYKVVANLPYYVTSPVIRKFLENEAPPKEMVLMVQKEVAQRICSKPPRMNLLAVSVQFYAKPKILFYVSKKSFWPSPKVDGAILKISAFIQCKDSAFNQRFFRIIKAGFSQPRKQLVNNLAKSLKLDKIEIRNWLLKNNIQPTQRAETLRIEDWVILTKTKP